MPKEQWLTLFWGGFKITEDGDCSHEIKRLFLLESYDQPRQVTATPHLRLGAAAKRSNPTSKERWLCGHSRAYQEELPHV